MTSSLCSTPQKQIVRSHDGVSRYYETEEREPLFSTKIETNRAGPLGELPEQDGFAVSYYTTPSGKKHAIIQQRPTGQPCGNGCLMMLFLDRLSQAKNPQSAYAHESRKEHSFIDYFYRDDSLAHAYTLKQIAANYNTGLDLQVIGFATKDHHEEDQNLDKRVSVATGKGVVRHLKSELKTGHSVMQAITHPQLAGHWVIIDEFAKGFFYGRDPWSGKPFKISDQALAPMLLKEIKIEYAIKV